MPLRRGEPCLCLWGWLSLPALQRAHLSWHPRPALWPHRSPRPSLSRPPHGHRACAYVVSSASGLSRDEALRGSVFCRGVGAMELVAMDMKVSGMYIARQLSFSGVTFRIEEIPLSPAFEQVYNRAARLVSGAIVCLCHTVTL